MIRFLNFVCFNFATAIVKNQLQVMNKNLWVVKNFMFLMFEKQPLSIFSLI
jgi:hypothetical protein